MRIYIMYTYTYIFLVPEFDDSAHDFSPSRHLLLVGHVTSGTVVAVYHKMRQLFFTSP